MKKKENSTNYLFGIFIYSSGSLLLLTSIAKLISSGGHDHILSKTDPIFDISFRSLLYLAAMVELGVAIVCFFCNNRRLQVSLIALLASYFVLYRMGLLWLGFRLTTCRCLGFLTDALHVSASKADTTMKIILAYLLIGGYAALFCLWRQNRKTERKPQNDEVKPSATRSEMPFGS